MTIAKPLRYKDMARYLYAVYKYDDRIEDKKVLEDLIKFFEENKRDIIYVIEGDRNEHKNKIF